MVMLKRLKKIDYIENDDLNNFSATEKLKRLLGLYKSFQENKDNINTIIEKDKKSLNSLKRIFLFFRIDNIFPIMASMLITMLIAIGINYDNKKYIENRVEKLNISLVEGKDKIFHQFVNKELLGQELTLTEKYNLFETFLIDNKFKDVSKKIDTFKLGESNSEKGRDILYWVQNHEKIKDELNDGRNILLFLMLFTSMYIYFIPLFSNLSKYQKVKKESENRKKEIYELSKRVNYLELSYLEEWNKLNISEEKITFKEFYEKQYINESNSKLDNKLTKLAILEHVPDKVIYKNILSNNSYDLLNIDLKKVEEYIIENLDLKDR